MNRYFRLCTSFPRYSRSTRVVITGYRRLLSTKVVMKTKRMRRITTATTVFLLTAGVATGTLVFLENTSSLQLFQYARSHKHDLLHDASWRDCVAVSLVDLYRQQTGPEIMNRMHWGRSLGSWIADDNKCSPEIMTVLLLLSNANASILADALDEGGVVVLDKLYDHNRKDCETAIIQLIKLKNPLGTRRPDGLILRLHDHPADIFSLGLLWLLQGADLSVVPFDSIPLPSAEAPRSIRLKYAELMLLVSLPGSISRRGIRLQKEEIKDNFARQLLSAVRTIRDKRRLKRKEKEKDEDERVMEDAVTELSEDLTKFDEAYKESSHTEEAKTTAEKKEVKKEKLDEWMKLLLSWCEDADSTVVDEAIKAINHFSSQPYCTQYLAKNASNLILRLFEEMDNTPTVSRKRCLSQLVEALSGVLPSEDEGRGYLTDVITVYCFDSYEEVMGTEMRVIGEDILPVDVVQYSTEPKRWMQFIVHMCFQRDLIVLVQSHNNTKQKLSGVHTLRNFLANSTNREEMAMLWAQSLFKLLEPQARPVVAEEAKAYVARGQKTAKDRPWWPLRCMLRSLGLFCEDEQMAEVMLARQDNVCRMTYSGLLQYLKALSYHTEASLRVQMCRILSDLSFQKNPIGDYTRATVRREWLPTLAEWCRDSDTKLHFHAKKVLFNCSENNDGNHYLDEPIFLLYDCDKGQDRIADIVFVHGLQGSFFSTWMVQKETTDYHHITCWPAEMLPRYLCKNGVMPPVRIFSVGYHARMMKSSSPHPTLSIMEQASDLRNRLESAGIGERPVIFVTHSMGGLIVKEMLVDDRKDVYSPLLHQTKAVVFYSTPHRGSPIINNSTLALKAFFGFTPIVTELKGESPVLLKLNDDFIKLTPRPEVMCLGEELPMKAGKYEAVVVPPSSAKLDIGSWSQMVGTNHMTVCKPKDENDPVFVKTAEFIEEQLDKIVNLDNITVEGIVEKARWRDRLIRLAQQTILPYQP